MVIMIIKNKKRKYPNFQLDWNFHDKKALTKARRAIRMWIVNHTEAAYSDDTTIKDMIMEIDPELYNGFSRGDKSRIGKAFSKLYNLGYYPELFRGKPENVTNTYHL